jgi:soluble lytic murein transglycosylase-like protein
MTAGQVIVILSLLAQVYGVDPAVLDCIAYRESTYSVTAVNGGHQGVMQWNPDTRAWLSEKAQADPLWLHGGIGEGPVYNVALAAWAVKNHYGNHWSTWEMCGGEG